MQLISVGYVIQTPFYADFKGFWSLSIKWLIANDKDAGSQCSQILALLEADRTMDTDQMLREVQVLSQEYPHPIFLLTRLLEQHIVGSVAQFTDITGRVADIERKLRDDVGSQRDLAHSNDMTLTHRKINCDLHQCSVDVVDLEKRRRFEKEMGAVVDKLISSTLANNRESLPSACKELEQRTDLFRKIAESRDLDIASLPRRISTQMTVLYNQIAQRDAWVNLDIAKAAREDNVVMIDDSTAMKTIAVLTIVFLPGTFIAVSLHRILVGSLANSVSHS